MKPGDYQSLLYLEARLVEYFGLKEPAELQERNK